MLRLSRKRLTPKLAKLSHRSSSESSPPWSDLTPLVLERIRDSLESNLYDVRLRSVCSNWRKSLAHPRRTRSLNFPIHLPAIPETEGMLPNNRPRNPQIPNCSRIYRISPADEPSHGWLFRSLDTKPNTFTLLDPLHTFRVKCRPKPIRNALDLLQFRISEICKCYRIDGVDWQDVDKVLFLPNFVEDIAFTVLVVLDSGNMYYCNDGDSVWTAMEAEKKYWFQDVILFNGICYAVCKDGCLVSLNSNFHLTEVIPPDYRMNNVEHNSLVVFESDLFLVSEVQSDLLELQIFKRVLTSWNVITDLGDIFLLSSSEVSVGLSAKDFNGCKGNFVFYADAFTNLPYDYEEEPNDDIGTMENEIYDLDLSKTLNSKKKRLRRIKMCWPPPEWTRLTSKSNFF